jgi:hypothetical protein
MITVILTVAVIGGALYAIDWAYVKAWIADKLK